MITLSVFAAIGSLEVLGCAWWIRCAIRRQREAERLYGRSRGIRLRRTRHPVPGLPRDGHKLSEQEEAALAEIESRARSRTT
jgi:hypothetical protein